MIKGKKIPLRPNASIFDCEQAAKKNEGWDSAFFDLVGPVGRLKAKWLDAHMGLFVIEGQPGFNTSEQFNVPIIHCENLRIES